MELSEYPELASAWREIRGQLRHTVGDSTYDLWLAQLDVETWDGSLLSLRAPQTTAGWVSERFGRVVERTVRGVLGPEVRVQFEGIRRTRDQSSAADGRPASGLNPRYSFSQFVIGEGNRLAHAAALAVAELPGQAYNPLFLHAPPGLGKTHLLHAIGNYVLRFGQGSRVRFATAETFTNHFLTALGTRSISDFKARYRDVDILLVDDVQFLASKARTEEEFFHTFNMLYESGRQLVVSCDRMPGQMVGIEERLRERFEAGLVADMGPPDFETRLTILRKRAELDLIPIPDPAALALIAHRITSNVRSLEGALIRVVAYHSLTGDPIDESLVVTVLDRIYPPNNTENPSIADIQRKVSDHYGVSVQELLSDTRQARIAWPRHVAIHLARELAGASLQALGDAFGGRTHTTVVHACKRVAERQAADQGVATEINDLMLALRSTRATGPAGRLAHAPVVDS